MRLQARRHGAGMAVSEMVSSFAIRYGNRRTLEEMLRIHPGEHPVSVQLFGPDPEVMRGAAATVAEAGADIARPEHGLPGPEDLQDRGGRGADWGSRQGGRGRRAAREGRGYR